MKTNKGKDIMPKKSYEKPTWVRQEMFERFALGCTKINNTCKPNQRFS
jgi:hypothetical protein